jgi:hypothetical protein
VIIAMIPRRRTPTSHLKTLTTGRRAVWQRVSPSDTDSATTTMSDSYLPVRSLCAQPGQQHGRR